MKRAVIILFVIIAVAASSTQAKEVLHLKTYFDLTTEQLQSMLAKARNDTARLEILNSLIADKEASNNPNDIDTNYIKQLININTAKKLINDKPYRMLLQAMRVGLKKDLSAELALLKSTVEEFDHEGIDATEILLDMRWVFNIVNKQEEKRLYYTKKVNQYLQEKNYHNAAACYHSLAGYYMFIGDLNSGVNNYLKADELFKSFSKFWYVNEILVVGNAYNEWGNQKKALIYLRKGLDLEINYNSNDDIYYALYTISLVEYELKHYNESLAYVNKVYSYQNRFKFDSADTLSLYVLKTVNYVALNRLDDAFRALQKIKNIHLSELTRISNNGIFDPEYAFYQYYLAINDLPNAEHYLLANLEKSKTDASVSDQLKYLRDVVDFYAKEKNIGKAWKYTVIYNRMSDSVQLKTNGFNVASYENEQKEQAQNKQLASLQQQRVVQEAIIGQRNIIIWISLVGLLIVCGSLVFIYRQLHINKKTLADLKQTQNQLIQSEKMASLGELTAGIAHEIQNPLNFVNNFSEVSVELLDELKEEAAAGNNNEVITIADDLSQNLGKINYHGKRADFIVKGMLQHSRTSTGERQPTKINILADEFLKLSYHGLRAKDKSFNADIKTQFADDLPLISVVQQDIGRVLLNLFNNAFYAVHQKQKTAGTDYKPEITVTTSAENNHVTIIVKDNGIGIPDPIRDKIMQPFFTTKPTGEGTGLGLSLTYDMVVKGHGGSINVNTSEGEFAEFIINLPIG